MKYRRLFCSTVVHVCFLLAALLLDPWYMSVDSLGPVCFWLCSLLSVTSMALCGVKNPGKLRSGKGREVSLERLAQHMKNMSTSSLDGMIEQTSQVHLDPKPELKPVVEESGENPYARIEVELGSDSGRGSREQDDPPQKAEVSAPDAVEVSQAPTVPIKAETLPPLPLLSEGKQFPDPAAGQYLRFCPVCSVDQLLRSKHCNICQVCIATYDHHCPWLGACIGEKNRILFLVFLTVFLSELVIGFVHSVDSSLTTWSDYGLLTVLSAAGAMVTSLYVHHLFLIWRNLTTWEFLAKSRISYLKNWPSRWYSPFNSGLLSTLHAYIVASSSRAPFIRWQLPEATEEVSDKL